MRKQTAWQWKPMLCVLWTLGCLLLVDAGCSSGAPGQPELVATTASALTPMGSVTWTDVVGVNAVGNSLTKTAADGWGNAGAASNESLSGDGNVQFTTGEATTHKMAGLTHTVADSGYATIDYAIYLIADGTIDIFEGGTRINQAFGTYVSGDVFSVSVSGNVVTYLKNGTLLYTSSNAPTFPLVVDCSLYSNGATVNNVNLTAAAYWQNVAGVTTSTNNLTMTAADGWGNAGASTVSSLSGDGNVQFTTAEATTHKMAGLTHTVADNGYATIDYAIYMIADGTIDIFEDGTRINQVFGGYVAGDVFSVSVSGSVVTYLKNGTLLYTSAKAPTFPLYADASLYSHGATINNVTLTSMPFWQNVAGATVTSNSLTKTGAVGWNAGGSSSASLNGDGYVQFSTSEANTHKMAGLTHTVADNGYATIDYGIYLVADGSVDIYEDGALINGAVGFGTYKAGDLFTIQVTGGTVTYFKNSTTLYTSAKIPTYPLVLDASLYSTGATITSASVTANHWTNAVGVTTAGNDLTKTGEAGWNAGASTIAGISGDGWAEFTTGEANTYKMAGLTHAVADSGYTTIDYAIYMLADGTLDIYENGTLINATFGTYAASDVFRIQVVSGVVTYLKNGSLLYTSTKMATFPMVVDASLYSTGATIQNVDLASWQSVAGVTTSGTTLTKTGTAGWNAGAYTSAALSGDGYAEFTAGEANTHKMVGLTHAVADNGYSTIDYAIYFIDDGTVDIYEAGTLINGATGFGSYSTTDVFRIQSSGGVVTYLKNGSLLYTSAKTPTFPMVVDASLYSPGASISVTRIP